MSDSNRTAIRYVRESTQGTTPNNPAFQEMLVRSSSLKYNPQSVTDDQIRSDEQIVDQNLVGYDVQGDLQCRLTLGALNDLIESANFSTWVKKANNIVSAVSGTQYTIASGGTSYAVNALVKASNFTTAGNNGLKTVTASTATTVSVAGLTIEGTPPATAKIELVGMTFASGDAATNSAAKTLTVTAGDLTTLGLVAGAWVKIGGTATADKFATAGCNGFARVSSATSKILTFDIVPTGWGTDAGTGKTIKLFISNHLRNGSTKTTYTFERQYDTDTAGTFYEYFRGVNVGKWDMKLSPRANIEMSFELMGLDASQVVSTRGEFVVGSGSIMGTPTTIAAPASDILNTSSNVAHVRVNGAVLAGATAVTDLTISSDRNLRMREGVGQAAAVDIRRGRTNVTASATAYFESTSMINLVRNDTSTSMDLALLADDQKSGYLIDMPKIKASDGSIDVQGVDTDITVPMQFQALRHDTLGYTLHTAHFNYLEV